MMADSTGLKTVFAKGTQLTYVEQGMGEAVVFVHGSLGDYRSWRFQLEPFSQKYRAFSYSRRYHYPNEWVGEGSDYSPGLHADDLIALIEHLHLAPVRVVGNSFGAYTALVAAIRRPDLMRKLVIGEPPILPWLKDVPGGQRYWDDFMENAWIPARRAFQRGNLEQGVQRFVEGVSGPGDFSQVPEVGKRAMMDNARSLEAETLSPNYFTEITPQQVRRIPVPMLLLKGERSPKMFHLIVDRLAQTASNFQQATIPNASHSMASGNPRTYNQVVLAFLDGE